MDTSRIEELLEEISGKLDDINTNIEELSSQLVWFSGGTFAEKVVDALHAIKFELESNR